MADDRTMTDRPGRVARVGSAAAVAAILVVSTAVGALIFAYGAAVRDICLDAGLGQVSSNVLAVVACWPILAALYTMDS